MLLWLLLTNLPKRSIVPLQPPAETDVRSPEAAMKAVFILKIDGRSPAHTQLETALGLQAVTYVAKREIPEAVFMTLNVVNASTAIIHVMIILIGDIITLPIVAQADAHSQFQFTVTLAQQVIDLERNGNTLNLVGCIHDKREVTIAIGITNAHAVAQAVVALETGVKIDAHKIVHAL